MTKGKILTIAAASMILALSTHLSYAQELGLGFSAYGNGYDDGYEDGYDDAMDDCPCPPKLTITGGLYVGGNINYDSFSTNRNIMWDNDFIGRIHSSSNGWGGNIYTGYGQYFKEKYYLGAELSVGASAASSKDYIDSLNYTGTIDAGTTFGISILPGIKLSDRSMLFGRLGYVDTQIRSTETWGSLSYSVKNWTSGFEFGLGTETKICPKFNLRTEFDHIDYSSFKNFETGTRNYPSDNLFSVGINYRF